MKKSFLFPQLQKYAQKEQQRFFFSIIQHQKDRNRSYRHKNYSKNRVSCINTEDTDKDNAEKQHTFTFKSQEWNSS